MTNNTDTQLTVTTKLARELSIGDVILVWVNNRAVPEFGTKYPTRITAMSMPPAHTSLKLEVEPVEYIERVTTTRGLSVMLDDVVEVVAL